MLLLTLTLVFMLFRRVEVNSVPNKSRWLMAAGTTLLGLQFMLQFTLRLREMGETQAVILNMLMLIPAAWLLIIAVLYLQRQGRLTWYEWLAGPVGWIIIVILILSATLSDDLPFFSDTPTIRRAEYIGAVIFFIILFYYLYLQLAELRHIRRSLKNFYDHDMSNLLRWMELCIWVLAGTAIFIPAAILLPGRQLSFFGVFCIGGIYYLVLSFKDYVQGRNIVQVMAAQKNAAEAGIDNDANNSPTINEDDMKRVPNPYSAPGSTLPAMNRIPIGYNGCEWNMPKNSCLSTPTGLSRPLPNNADLAAATTSIKYSRNSQEKHPINT